jgi:hypothetical protein
VLPARLPELDGPSFVREPVKAVLTGEGAESRLTQLDSGGERNRELWQGMPDVADFEHLGGVKPGAVVLLDAQVQGKTEPLLVQQRYGLGNAYILATGGTWRWQMQLPHEDQRHETFWRQLLQALATSAPGRVTLSAVLSREHPGTVQLQAEVNDKEFEPTDDATVTVTASRGPGPGTPIELTRVPGQQGMYAASYETDGDGLYRFQAEASLEEQSLGTAAVAVRRNDGAAEHFHIQQNRPLLERLSSATGGRYFALAGVDALPEAIRFSNAGIVEREVLDLWNMPINFLLLLLLKSGEWLLRLRWGRL